MTLMENSISFILNYYGITNMIFYKNSQFIEVRSYKFIGGNLNFYAPIWNLKNTLSYILRKYGC